MSVTYVFSPNTKIKSAEINRNFQDAANPVGTILVYAGAENPEGYLFCSGAAVSRTVYSALFDVIGTTYGAGDGSTTFNLPDLEGRVPVGGDASDSAFDTLGETGGAKTHTLTTNEMPSHTHTQNAHSHSVTDPGHTHRTSQNSIFAAGSNREGIVWPYDGGLGNDIATQSSTTGISIQNATATNQNTGGGAAHNNLQPYIVLNYIIKY